MSRAPKLALTYDEFDEILRGGGHDDAIGMSAIDGLIAALVAAPAFVHPDEWVPLIFGGKRPGMRESSVAQYAVQTIFNRYNEVSTALAEQPNAYRPIFMVDEDGTVIARDWAVGFMLGVGLRSKEWGARIVLTEHRRLLTPILVYHDLGTNLLPEMPAVERYRRRATAYREIAQAVAAIRAICNPRRATEASRETTTPRRSRKIRR
jgi:yecA family protein